MDSSLAETGIDYNRATRLSGLDFERHLVLEAPEPVLAGLEGADDRMAGGVMVLRGVAARRVVAAADLAADHALAEVDPPAARLQALGAPPRCSKA
jgi:hypothetical protein